MTDFDAETAMTAGGWHPRHARVLDVQVNGDVAAALVDANGDGTEINIDVFVRSPEGGWTGIASGNGSIQIPGWYASSEDGQHLVLTRTARD